MHVFYHVDNNWWRKFQLVYGYFMRIRSLDFSLLNTLIWRLQWFYGCCKRFPSLYFSILIKLKYPMSSGNWMSVFVWFQFTEYLITYHKYLHICVSYSKSAFIFHRKLKANNVSGKCVIEQKTNNMDFKLYLELKKPQLIQHLNPTL